MRIIWGLGRGFIIKWFEILDEVSMSEKYLNLFVRD